MKCFQPLSSQPATALIGWKAPERLSTTDAPRRSPGLRSSQYITARPRRIVSEARASPVNDRSQNDTWRQTWRAAAEHGEHGASISAIPMVLRLSLSTARPLASASDMRHLVHVSGLSCSHLVITFPPAARAPSSAGFRASLPCRSQAPDQSVVRPGRRAAQASHRGASRQAAPQFINQQPSS